MTSIIGATIVAGSLLAFTAAHAFDLQGHRGARGLAPENTLAGFETALAIGVTTLELDLGVTKDGVVVVSHDSNLNPDHTRGPEGKFLDALGPAIRALTLAELKRYDVGRLKPGTPYAKTFPQQRAVDGATIPTLAEVFDLVRRLNADQVRFNIETKLTPTSGAGVADRARRRGRPGSTSTIMAVRCRGWWPPLAARSGRRTTAPSRPHPLRKPNRSASSSSPGPSTSAPTWSATSRSESTASSPITPIVCARR
jgi:hypothetical protein